MLIEIYIISFYSAVFLTFLIGALVDAEGLEFVNPIYLYNRFNVNWFGAAFISLLFNILILPVAIFYWIYKLCTVGKK